MPDLSKMQVKVGIHESFIDRMKPGLAARVSLPDMMLDGEVSSVAAVTGPAGWWNGNVVKYDTVVALPSIPGLKPGRSANSRIKIYGLLRDDYRRIIENIPSIRRALPMRELRFKLRLGNRTADAKLVGCVEEHLELNRLEIARGRWLTPRDRGKKVVVLAHNAAKRLFPFENPIGRTIWVGIVFGVYPARQAAYMNPIEALRHE